MSPAVIEMPTAQAQNKFLSWRWNNATSGTFVEARVVHGLGEVGVYALHFVLRHKLK